MSETQTVNRKPTTTELLQDANHTIASQQKELLNSQKENHRLEIEIVELKAKNSEQRIMHDADVRTLRQRISNLETELEKETVFLRWIGFLFILLILWLLLEAMFGQYFR